MLTDNIVFVQPIAPINYVTETPEPQIQESKCLESPNPEAALLDCFLLILDRARKFAEIEEIKQVKSGGTNATLICNATDPNSGEKFPAMIHLHFEIANDPMVRIGREFHHLDPKQLVSSIDQLIPDNQNEFVKLLQEGRNWTSLSPKRSSNLQR